ncbi:MAG: zinc ribbon domain-containing protein [Acidobacteria bacterium]|nr:MAG: zinc ribbon domain-containing protein [Acidobacteriota bacterium]REJ98658.1 MAG: zinc ribbon domain-containing protein [Acidobacteriota bacterium]REK16686.1 MAG: zinc ribbon domain-containing protein [Acidobacteriota bacterium]REK42597.1 MAG: zinc ribbon domain-containing protein [Acidobacteriota bacterium]
MGLDTIYCPKCGTENSAEVRFCRNCGAELETVAALVEGRLVVAEDKDNEGFFRKASWEKALTAFSLGVVLLIISFIFGVDSQNDTTTPWLALLVLACPLIGFGVGQIIKVSNKDKKAAEMTVRAARPIGGNDTRRLAESKTDYVSPDSPKADREEMFAPGSVVEATTRHLEMQSDVETNDLADENKQ